MILSKHNAALIKTCLFPAISEGIRLFLKGEDHKSHAEYSEDNTCKITFLVDHGMNMYERHELRIN